MARAEIEERASAIATQALLAEREGRRERAAELRARWRELMDSVSP